MENNLITGSKSGIGNQIDKIEILMDPHDDNDQK